MENGERMKLCSYMQEENEEIEVFLRRIRMDNFEKQSELSFHNLLYYSSQQLPEFE